MLGIPSVTDGEVLNEVIAQLLAAEGESDVVSSELA